MLWTPSHPILPPSSTSLLRIPLFIASAYLTHLATTPPNPPTKPAETAHYGKGSNWLASSTLARPLAFVRSSLRWIAVISESAVILSSNFTTPLSNSVISFLVPDRIAAAGIRFTPVRLVGIGLMLAGSLIRLSCHNALGRFFTWEISLKEDQRLVTSGPYSIVRHPSYAGYVLVHLGIIMCDFGSGSWYATSGLLDSPFGRFFALAMTAWAIYIPAKLIYRAPLEDVVLREKFGEEWEAYARKTPYRIIPYIY